MVNAYHVKIQIAKTVNKMPIAVNNAKIPTTRLLKALALLVCLLAENAKTQKPAMFANSINITSIQQRKSANHASLQVVMLALMAIVANHADLATTLIKLSVKELASPANQTFARFVSIQILVKPVQKAISSNKENALLVLN